MTSTPRGHLTQTPAIQWQPSPGLHVDAPTTDGRAYHPAGTGAAPTPVPAGPPPRSPRRPDDAQGMATDPTPTGATVQHVPATVGVPKRKMKITPKQRQVLHYARQGMTNAEIATAMNVKPTTVKTHWDAIYERLGVRRRATALCRCYEMGILQ